MAIRSKILSLFKDKSLDLSDPSQRRQAMELAVEQYMDVWRESSNPKLAAEKLVPAIKAFKELELDTLPIFQLAISRNPADAPLTLYVAEKLLDLNDQSDEAIQCFRRALQPAPNPLPYYLALENIYSSREDAVNLSFIYEQYFYHFTKWEEEAAAGHQRFDETDQTTAQELFDRALPTLVEFYVVAQRKDKRIMPVLERALSGYAESVEVIEMLAMIYLQDDRTDPRALEIYETLLAYKQDCLPVTQKLAEHYYEANRLAEALPLYQALCASNENKAQRIHHLIRLVDTALALPSLPEDCIPFLREYLKQNPADDRVLLALGQYYAAAGSLSTDAVSIYQGLMKLNQATPAIKALLGKHAYESRSWIDVVEIFERRFHAEPENPDVVFPLAEAYCEFDRRDAIAIAVYESALKLGTTNRAVYLALSKYYFDNGIGSPKAIRCFKETLARAGSDISARMGLSQSLLKSGDFESCFSEVTRFLKRHPDNEQGLAMAAQALSADPVPVMMDMLGRLDVALQRKILKAACEKKKNKILTQKLAEVYLAEGRPTPEQELLLEEALTYSPRNVELLEALSRLAYDAGDWVRAMRWDSKLYELCVLKRASASGDAKTDQLSRHAIERICRRLTTLLLDHEMTLPPAISGVFQDAYAMGLKDQRLLRRLATEALMQDDTSTEAEGYYRALLKIEPDNHAVQVQIQMCNLERRNLDEIFAFCERQLNEGRFDSRTLQLLLQSQTHSHQAPESLIRLVDRLYLQHKNDPQLLLCLAHLYASAERYSERAIEIYEKALSLEPGNTFIISRLAKAHETIGNVEKSIEKYQQVLQSLPEDAEILTRLAHAYYYHKDSSDEALKTTQRAVECNPENPKTAMFLAHLYFLRGAIAEAVQVLDDMVNRIPASIPRAIMCLEDFVAAADPEHVNASLLRLKLGQLYLKRGKINNAYALFTQLSVHYEKFCGELLEGYGQVIEIDPTHVPARVERAVLLKLIGDYDAAIKDFEEIFEFVGDDTNVLYELLEIYELSIAAAKTESTDMIFKAGMLALQIAEYDKAIALFQRILQKDRQNYQARLAVGKCFHRKGQFEIALKYYHQVEKNDEILELLYELADNAYAAQQRRVALQALNEIIAVDITYRDVSHRAAELEAELPGKGEAGLDKTSLGSVGSSRRYDLLNVIGRGSMGVVYKAYDRELSEHVALKVLPSEFSNHPEALERFRSEARAARRLTHRNVIRIHDIGEEGGQRFISMELVEGQNLRSLIRNEKPLAPKRTIPIIVQVAKALQYAHSQGVMHRDIKPANILLTTTAQVKLTDFGIAAIIEEISRTPDTADIILGTPLYMAPEQAEGRTVTFASEVYSLGVVMYEMLSGEPPFMTGNIIYHHIFTVPSPLEKVPAAVNNVVMKALEKKPENRYPTMDKFIEAIQRIPLA